MIRPILTYTAETRVGTSKPDMLETAEMSILRRIQENTLKDQIRSDEIRWKCSTEDINKWALNRKWELNNHICRTTDSRMVKITRNKSPVGKRSEHQPHK